MRDIREQLTYILSQFEAQPPLGALKSASEKLKQLASLVDENCNPIQVKIKRENLEQAVLIACQRQREAIKKHRLKIHPMLSLQNNIVGAVGEHLTSKFQGVFYDGAPGDLSAKDSGLLQVRSTSNPSYGLRIKGKDQSDDYFVFVRVNENKIVGWTTGRKGKEIGKKKRMSNGDEIYIVSEKDLWPMADLLKILPNLVEEYRLRCASTGYPMADQGTTMQ